MKIEQKQQNYSKVLVKVVIKEDNELETLNMEFGSENYKKSNKMQKIILLH